MAPQKSEARPLIPQADTDNYAFVMNVSRLVGADSYELMPGHVLRRATPDEIASIREILKSLVSAQYSLYGHFLWERRLPAADGIMEILSEEDWRYFVISFTGNNRVLADLSRAFDLANLEIELAFTVLSQGPIAPGLLWHAGRLFHTLEDALHNPGFFFEVSAEDVDGVRSLGLRLQNHDRSLLDIDVLAGRIGELKGFPHSSPLRFLGYFAILESLLTHAPKPSDPYDSITRQVRKKLTLLDHRFPQHMDYGAFGGASLETVWTRMYAYRSQLAHGLSPRFTGDLQLLVDHDTALQLVKETTKAVIRQALSEPQLLLDLRDC